MLGIKKKKNEPLQRWHVYLMLGVVLIASILWVVQKIRGVETVETSEQEISCILHQGVWDPENNICLEE